MRRLRQPRERRFLVKEKRLNTLTERARRVYRERGAYPKPKALDLFCCGGGAAQGLIDVGFDVTGVDVDDHSRVYPGDFVRGDALALDALGIDPGAAAFRKGGED